MQAMKIACWIALIALVACGKKPEPGKPIAPEGRAETQGIRNTQAIGMSGPALARQLDAALQENDQRKEMLDAAIESELNPP